MNKALLQINNIAQEVIFSWEYQLKVFLKSWMIIIFENFLPNNALKCAI